MRKSNVLNLNKILSIIFAIVMFFGVAGLFCAQANSKNKKVFATSNEYDNATQIYQTSGIISENLWIALKKFYNNNKTAEMPDIRTGENGQYLTINQFVDFPVDELDLSNEEIFSIYNLSIFDLSSFSKIDFSNNQIQYVYEELKNLDNLTEIDLSNNQLESFSYDDLSEECYSQNLQKLNISGNLIASCDLSLIASAEIDASNNKITKSTLTLPTNQNLSVDLNLNLIDSPEQTNANINYGFQGVKNKGTFVKSTKIGYYGIEGVEKVEIYSLTADEQDSEQTIETKIAELLEGQTYTFELGYYKLKFNSENFEDISVYIAPLAPTIKMFRNGEEIELTHQISSDVEIRLYGEDGAVFAVGNIGNVIEGNSIKITQTGVFFITVYQIVDGYVSFPTKFYLEYQKSNVGGFIFVLGAVVLFGAVFYLVIKFMPQITSIHLGKKKNKNDLDIK